MAQLGYACFWPNGGGVYEGNSKPSDDNSALDSAGETGDDKGSPDEHHSDDSESSDINSTRDALIESY